MDQETQKRVDRLNAHFLEFGLTPTGDYKFKWKHTTEMYFFILSDAMTLIWSPGLNRKTYCYDYAMLLEPKWVLAYWREPMPELEWFNRGLGDFPWPRNGEYHPIENIDMSCGVEPNEFETMRAIRDLRRHLAAIDQTKKNTGTDGVKQLVDQNKARMEAHKCSIRSEMESRIDNAMTAFGKIPGKVDGGVGLQPAGPKRIKQSGGDSAIGELNGTSSSS